MNLGIDDHFRVECFDAKPCARFNFSNKIYAKSNLQFFQKFSTILRKFAGESESTLEFRDLVHIHSDFSCFDPELSQLKS